MTDEPTVERVTELCRFDWQAEPEGFLKWLLPTLLAKVDQTVVNDLCLRTDDWRNVHLQVSINDVEVDTAHFIQSLEANLDLAARDAAAKLVSELLSEEISGIETWLRAVQRDVQREVRVIAERRGVDLTDLEDA